MAGIGNNSEKRTVGTSEVADVLEERLIDAEYKIWKKNTPYLYDVVMTHALEWPSLTCQWLPLVHSNTSADVAKHSLLLGTHTTGEQNYLLLASCNLPKHDTVIDNRTAVGGGPAAASGAASENSGAGNQAVGSSDQQVIPAANYDEDKREMGGFGHGSQDLGKIQIRLRVKHEGEVNRARHMPQNQFIVATRGPEKDLYVFDLSKHPSVPPKDSSFCPEVICQGHTSEGYGMAWSPLKEGYLLSGGFDKTVCLWDVQQGLGKDAKSGNRIDPIQTFKKHDAVVEDVDWHCKDSNMIASVSDDRSICIWDTRESAKPMHCVSNAHEGDINCVTFNPTNEHTFATGSGDKTVALWDLRNLKRPSHILNGHTDEVYVVDWSPFNESVLGSCSADRRVAIWDLSRIGAEQSAEDAEDGPPELLFLHGGHTSKVSDFGWNQNENWMMASVSEDNVLQVWSMAEEIYLGDDDDEGDEEKGEGNNTANTAKGSEQQSNNVGKAKAT